MIVNDTLHNLNFCLLAAVCIRLCGGALPALYPEDADCLVREAGGGVDHLRVQAQQVGQQGPLRAQPRLGAGVCFRYKPLYIVLLVGRKSDFFYCKKVISKLNFTN